MTERSKAAARGKASSSPAADARRDAIALVLWRILFLNAGVAAAKLVYGYRVGAIAITADGFHSMVDASSNVIGLVAVSVARRPPDANHPYGHRKYETFATLGIAAMMFFGCWEILGGAIERVRHPRTPEVTAAGFLVIAITLAVNLFVVWSERRQGRRLQSDLLLSDAAHTGSDVLASLLVLASFAAVRFGVHWADVAAAVVIVALILRAGYVIVRSTMATLSDERRIDPRLVEQTVLSEPGVLEAHNVRSRGPHDDIHVDLHILVEPSLAIAEAHKIGHRVESRVRDRWPGVTDVVVHVEPGLASERGHPGATGGLEAEG